jgi:uncharacterized protein
VRFTWDVAKASSNLKKHGVSFDEAASAFVDPLALVSEDVMHPERSALVGLSKKQRILVAVFVEHAEDSIRIISARRATSHERRRYEEGHP